MGGLSWTSTISNNKILESRLGYTRFAQLIDVNNKVDPKSLESIPGPSVLRILACPTSSIILVTAATSAAFRDIRSPRGPTRLSTGQAFLLGEGKPHDKLGGNFQRACTNSLRNEARSGMTMGYFQSYLAPYFPGDYLPGVAGDVEELLLGKADFASRSFGDTHRHITQNSVGFYAQDDWKIKPRLTLNYGLRYEINGTMRDTNNNEAVFLPPPGPGFAKVGTDIDGVHRVELSRFRTARRLLVGYLWQQPDGFARWLLTIF